ncbi:MAG: TolC family protein [candidate division NC10 bacterium]|nr:TolC family protein [candidate division NC10 bacterium]
MARLRERWITLVAVAALLAAPGPVRGEERPAEETGKPQEPVSHSTSSGQAPSTRSPRAESTGSGQNGTVERPAVSPSTRSGQAPVEPPAQQTGAPEATVPTPGQVLVLSLQESILLGLKNNLDIAIEGFNPKIRDADVTAAKAVFDPTAFAEIFYSTSTLQNRSGLATNVVNENKDVDAAVGIRQQLPTGADYEVRYGTNRNDTNTSFLQVLNPAYTNDLTLTLSQPLLKNFGVDVNRTAIKIAQNEREISGDQFRQRIMEVTTQVQRSYWDLVFALENLKVQERSLRLARELADLNRARVRAGVAAKVEVTQAEAEVAARETDVIVAEKGVRDAEDRLKVVLNLPSQGQWGGAIMPGDPARFAPVTVDLPGVVADALQKRPEYRSAKVELANRELQFRFTRNQLLPELSLEGGVGVNGLGRNFGDANEELSSRDFYEASVGLVLTVPLGNRAARSEFIKARLARDQAQLSLRSVELNITAEVREAVRRVEADAKRVDSTQLGRVLAEEQLRIEQKRLEAGVSTTFEVLRLQRDLTAAQANEVKSLTDYNSSLANLDRAHGVVLEKHQIQM